MLTAMSIGISVWDLIGVLLTSATLEMYGSVMWNPLLMLQFVQLRQYAVSLHCAYIGRTMDGPDLD